MGSTFLVTSIKILYVIKYDKNICSGNIAQIQVAESSETPVKSTITFLKFT